MDYVPGVVGIALPRRSRDGGAYAVFRFGAQAFCHRKGVALLALEVGDNRALGIAGKDMNVHGLGLPETPAAPDSLVLRLK